MCKVINASSVFYVTFTLDIFILWASFGLGVANFLLTPLTFTGYTEILMHFRWGIVTGEL